MKKIFQTFIFIFILASCSNTPELETGEIKTVQLLKNVTEQLNNPKIFVDARHLLSRDQVDAFSIPILFVELETGQNGTLTPYPGQGVGQTWLGADGATVTLEQGILKASRGMGNDLMGATSQIPLWSKISKNSSAYSREIIYLTGNNKTHSLLLECSVKKYNKKETAKIWDVSFDVTRFEENCYHNGKAIKNTYYVDRRGIVRKSFQFHSETLGYITTKRLDR